MSHLNICPHLQVGGESAQADLALVVEVRAGRMPVAAVRIADVAGHPHLAWTAADGLDEALSLKESPQLAEFARARNGIVLAEFDSAGVIGSSAQVVRADAPETQRQREACNG